MKIYTTYKDGAKSFISVCSEIVELINSSTGFIAITIAYYFLLMNKTSSAIDIIIFTIVNAVTWGIWFIHAYNRIKAKKLDKIDFIITLFLIITYVCLIFIFTYSNVITQSL